MLKYSLRFLVVPLMVLSFGLMTIPQANAYSCGAVFKQAQGLIKKAEALVTKDTDSRIKSMILEAKGMADAGIISHKAAMERHTGKVGKYAHSDSVRKGRQAVALIKQALFLLTGTPY